MIRKRIEWKLLADKTIETVTEFEGKHTPAPLPEPSFDCAVPVAQSVSVDTASIGDTTCLV